MCDFTEKKRKSINQIGQACNLYDNDSLIASHEKAVSPLVGSLKFITALKYITRIDLIKGVPLRVGFRKKEVTRARILVPHSNKNQLKPIYSVCSHFLKQIFA